MPAPALPTAHKSKATQWKVTIASTLTRVPGLKSFTYDGGEVKTMDIISLDDAYEAPLNSGTKAKGTWEAELIWDPTNTVHQFLHARYNEATLYPTDTTAVMVSSIVLANSGKSQACNCLCTNIKVNPEPGGALMATLSGVFTTEISFNES